MEKYYYTYILANRKHGIIYVGITNDLVRRASEHKSGLIKGFTQRYHIDQLVCYDIFSDPRDAIEREKQLKRWHRDWKINLIEARNPEWKDLAVDPETSSG